MSRHAERMACFQKAGLYLVTSQTLSAGRSTLDVMREALEGGVKLIQLREKNMPLRDLMELAHVARDLTQSYAALLIINDRVDVALAVDADGVHLGLDDFPIEAARRIAPEMIIGASSHNIAEAEAAQTAGASYVNIGPIYPTNTKNWTDEFLGVEGLQKIAPHVKIPFTVMGGIKHSHIPELCASGARTLAVVTAVTQADDPMQAARNLLSEITCNIKA
jgi:thiamine-phosphate pyrophosphorylase